MSAPIPREDLPLLVARARRGDQAAFRELMEAHRVVVATTLAACGVRSRDTAFDLAQDVALKVWQNLDRLREPAAFSGWLRRMAANAARDHLRRLAARREASLEEALTLETEDDPHEHAERIAELRLMLAALGTEEHEVVELLVARAGGASVDDLAERMGLSKAALKMRLSRARQRLRRRLEELRDTPSS